MPGNYWLQRICAKDYSDDFRIYIFSRRALCIMFQWQVVTMHLRLGSLWSTWPWQHRSYVTGSLKAPTTICHTQIKGHLHSLVFLHDASALSSLPEERKVFWKKVEAPNELNLVKPCLKLTKGCPSLPILQFFNIVQNAFDPPHFLLRFCKCFIWLTGWHFALL